MVWFFFSCKRQSYGLVMKIFNLYDQFKINLRNFGNVSDTVKRVLVLLLVCIFYALCDAWVEMKRFFSPVVHILILQLPIISMIIEINTYQRIPLFKGLDSASALHFFLSVFDLIGINACQRHSVRVLHSALVNELKNWSQDY